MGPPSAFTDLLVVEVPHYWHPQLAQQQALPYWHHLQEFVNVERAQHTVFPAEENVFTALRLTPFDEVRVVILGQDPYHGTDQAHGLAFSVEHGVAIPPSLRNIFQELHSDLGIEPPNHGNLQHWAKQGVLLLNTTLTVRKGEAASHAGYGWEIFTDAIIALLNQRREPIVFVLWGAHAQGKRHLITRSAHLIIAAPHPSPLSAHKGFFGSRPFSTINDALCTHGFSNIDWHIPNTQSNA